MSFLWKGIFFLYFRTLLKDNVLESGDAMDVKRVLQEELGNSSNFNIN